MPPHRFDANTLVRVWIAARRDDLPSRIHNVLENHYFMSTGTLGDLAALPETQVLCFKNCGRKTLLALGNELRALGLPVSWGNKRRLVMVKLTDEEADLVSLCLDAVVAFGHDALNLSKDDDDRLDNVCAKLGRKRHWPKGTD